MATPQTEAALSEISPLVNVLMDARCERATRADAAKRIQALCHPQRAGYRERQRAVCECGGIGPLVTMAAGHAPAAAADGAVEGPAADDGPAPDAGPEAGSEFSRAVAFCVLGQLCFGNEPVAQRVATHGAYIAAVRTAVRDTSLDETRELFARGSVKGNAFYSAGNVAYNAPDAKAVLAQLAPDAAFVLEARSSHLKSTCAQAVNFCAFLSDNEVARAALISAGVVNPLSEVMRTMDKELRFFNAGKAVAELVGEVEEHPALSDHGHTAALAEVLVNMLDCALQGRAVPGTAFYPNTYQASRAIAKVSVADSSKRPLGDAGAIPALARVLLSAVTKNRPESQMWALKALRQLAFADEHHPKIISELRLIDLLRAKRAECAAQQGVHESLDPFEREVRESACGLLWQLGDRTTSASAAAGQGAAAASRGRGRGALAGLRSPFGEEEQKNAADGDDENADDDESGWALLSYPWSQQPLAMQINNGLRASGVPVWIDYERMSGHDMGEIALAIEKCSCLITVVCHDFKRSPNCRAEAEFAFRLGKPIIAVSVDARYKADGWLAMLLGPTEPYDFSEPHEYARLLPTLVTAINTAVSAEATRKAKRDETERAAAQGASAARAAAAASAPGTAQFALSTASSPVPNRLAAAAAAAPPPVEAAPAPLAPPPPPPPTPEVVAARDRAAADEKKQQTRKTAEAVVGLMSEKAVGTWLRDVGFDADVRDAISEQRVDGGALCGMQRMLVGCEGGWAALVDMLGGQCGAKMGTSFKFGYALTKLFEGGGEAAAPKPTFVFGSPVAAAAPETTADDSALATPVAAPAAPMADETDDPSPRQPSPPVFNFGSAS